MGSGASGEFVMDTAQVKIIGSRFADFSSRYKNLMTQMRTTIEDLGTCWKSEDYNQFLSIYEQNSETIDQMSRAYESFGEILTETGTNAEKASEDLRSSFGR